MPRLPLWRFFGLDQVSVVLADLVELLLVLGDLHLPILLGLQHAYRQVTCRRTAPSPISPSRILFQMLIPLMIFAAGGIVKVPPALPRNPL